MSLSQDRLVAAHPIMLMSLWDSALVLSKVHSMILRRSALRQCRLHPARGRKQKVTRNREEDRPPVVTLHQANLAHKLRPGTEQVKNRKV